MANKTLALFDFDGTITTKDSFLEMIKYHKGKTAFYTGMLFMLPHIVMYKARLINAQALKERVLTHFWKGMDKNDFEKICKDFSQHVLPGLLRPKAIDQVKKHISNGDTIAIVSASAENWLQPFCDIYSIQCIGTRLEINDGKITGKLVGKNCKGEEKICRVKELFDFKQFDQIIVYGDSGGDKPLLAMATTGNYKPFRS